MTVTSEEGRRESAAAIAELRAQWFHLLTAFGKGHRQEVKAWNQLKNAEREHWRLYKSLAH